MDERWEGLKPFQTLGGGGAGGGTISVKFGIYVHQITIFNAGIK